MKRCSILLTLLAFVIACDDKDLTSASEIQKDNLESSLLSDTVYSNVVTIEEAKKELEAFLSDNSQSISKSANEFRSKRIADGFVMNFGKKTLSKSSADSSDAKVYVFNFEDDGGFAIMSSTRETPPVFAITDGGNLDTTKEIDNPGLAIFMSNLEAKLINGELNYDVDTLFQDSVTSLKKNYTPSKSKKWSVFSSYRNEYYKNENGLCPNWHQRWPFNRECDSAGRPAFVGCVPLSCALLMSIYRYPKSYQGRTLNWDDMLVNNNSDDIAWLLRKLGDKENLDVTYGTIDSSDGSGAFPENNPRTLKNFGYSNGGKCDNYNTNYVSADLKKGYPVLIAGHSFYEDTISENGRPYRIYYGGHQWLGQGLMIRTRDEYHYIGEQQYTTFVGMTTTTDYYILCNMGWGNSWCNGYYLSKVFDVSEGPEFPESYDKPQTYSKKQLVGKNNYYQYIVKAVTGIRK